MKWTRAWWAVLILVLGTGFAVTMVGVASGAPQTDESASVGPVPSGVEPALGAATEGRALDPRGIIGSAVETSDCYQAGRTQTVCFTVYNGSDDGEWISQILLTFPTQDGAWQAACNSAFEDGQDSAGTLVDFTCDTPIANQIRYQDSIGGLYGISPGASWHTCVDVAVPATYDGIRAIPWVMEGDTGGSENGVVWIERCTPLRISPSEVAIEGCNGLGQQLDFDLENYAAGDNAEVLFSYDAVEASFSGPTGLSLSEGEVVTFTVELQPDLCLEPGEQVLAELTARSGEHVDGATIIQTISEYSGWRRREDSPTRSMDSVVVWALHQDGGLWSIGGYGSGGAAQRYDPGSGSWITYTNPLTPVIEYPMDGCYGLNPQGQEIVVLFPDTIVTDTLQVFNISTGQWSTRPVPTFFPPDYVGHWGFDVVSLLGNPVLKPGIVDANVCYLSGGANQPGGGRERNLWRYEPATNSGEYLGYFPANVWFGFHASWYVPWIGADGGICVAGGTDHNSQVTDVTQCYDIAAGTFHDANKDLGTLPEPWWGMADGWQITEHGYELWIANGVAGNGTLLPASAYFREGMSEFAYGPGVPEGLYRLEGDGYEGQFFTLNGARGGFSSSEASLQLAPCPTCREIYLPLVLRNR